MYDGVYLASYAKSFGLVVTRQLKRTLTEEAFAYNAIGIVYELQLL